MVEDRGTHTKLAESMKCVSGSNMTISNKMLEPRNRTQLQQPGLRIAGI